MAFPVAQAEGISETASPIPLATNAGDLLIAWVVVIDGASYENRTVPAGWARLMGRRFMFFGAYFATIDVYAKIAGFSEPTPTFSSPNVVLSSYRILLVTGAAGIPDIYSDTLIVSGTDLVYPSVTPADSNNLIITVGYSSNLDASQTTKFPYVVPSWGTGVKAPQESSYAYVVYNHATPTATGAKIVELSAVTSPDVPAYAATIVVSSPASEITLGNLSSTSSSVPKNAPVDYVVGEIVGKTAGSTLSLEPGTPFSLSGTTLSVQSGIDKSVGATYATSITETLAEATNSPKTSVIPITVDPLLYCQFIGAAVGTTTPVMPVHQPGDLLVAYLFRDGSATAPNPSMTDWTQVLVTAGTSCSGKVIAKIATSSSETGGTPTTATSCIVCCYRPGPGYTLSVGAAAGAQAASTTVSYPALTLQNTDGTSHVGLFAGHRSTNTSIENLPTGFVRRANALDATDEAVAGDTGPVSAFAGAAVSVGGTSSGWVSASYEIKATPIGGPAAKPTFQVTVIT